MMSFLVITETLSETDQLYLWVKKNRGVCSQIARIHGFTPSFVRSVLYGHCGSTGRLIERALIDAGAPFVRERIEAA